MADCLSANPPFELKTWRVSDREGIVVNPILNRIEPSQSKFHIKTKTVQLVTDWLFGVSVAPMSHGSATLHRGYLAALALCLSDKSGFFGQRKLS
jgi:hypothetical protein